MFVSKSIYHYQFIMLLLSLCYASEMNAISYRISLTAYLFVLTLSLSKVCRALLIGCMTALTTSPSLTANLPSRVYAWLLFFHGWF